MNKHFACEKCLADIAVFMGGGTHTFGYKKGGIRTLHNQDLRELNRISSNVRIVQ
jgi:hypothetical protein